VLIDLFHFSPTPVFARLYAWLLAAAGAVLPARQTLKKITLTLTSSTAARVEKSTEEPAFPSCASACCLWREVGYPGVV
jgi:hypothetical protein